MTLRKSDTLDKVLDLLNPRTWTKKAFHRTSLTGDLEEQWCVVGAIREVLHREHMLEDRLTRELYGDLEKTFHEQYPEITGYRGRPAAYAARFPAPVNALSVAVYNDHFKMDYDGIRAVLEKTRNGLRERGE